MENKVKEITETLVGSAKKQAAELAKEQSANGSLAMPQPLAYVECKNDDGEEFVLAILVDLSRGSLERLMRATVLQFCVLYEDLFVVDIYQSAHVFSSFASVVNTDAFRQETEEQVALVIGDGFQSVKKRIESEGIRMANPFIVPSKVQLQTIRLMDTCTLSVAGEVFEGIEGLMDYLCSQNENSRPYILNRSERFPCFDAEDYATEHRFYRNFLICKDKHEAAKRAKQLESLPSGTNFCLVNDELPKEMRPMVYYMDESMTMTVAL